jgi:hypothetical protein
MSSHLSAANDAMDIHASSPTPAGLLLEKLELPICAARDDLLTRLSETTGGYIGDTNAHEGRTK